MPATYTCSRCRKKIIWSSLSNSTHLVTLDAKAEQRFTLSWGPGDDPVATSALTYQKHQCTVPR